MTCVLLSIDVAMVVVVCPIRSITIRAPRNLINFSLVSDFQFVGYTNVIRP